MLLTGYWKIYYWPPLCFTLFISSFTILYIVSVLVTKHVYPLFPYGSDMGTIPPESCLLSQFINITAIVVFITLYIRYRQIEIGILNGNILLKRKWNAATLFLALNICIGLSLTANFQETAIEMVHYFGAFIVLMMGVLYFTLQSLISYHCYKAQDPKYRISKFLLVIRILINVITFVTFPIATGGVFYSKKLFTGKHIYYWTEADGGFSIRLASTFSEWIIIIAMLTYILTFTREFKNINFAEIKFIDKLEESLNNKENLEIQET